MAERALVLARGCILTRSLADRLDDETMRAAWARVRRSPGAGLDGVNGARFAERLDANLAALRDELRGARYVPGALLRREIPKPSGGVRRLGVPNLRDRLAQAAVLAAAGDSLDAPLSCRVHGYRRGCSPRTAVDHLVAQVGARPWLEIVHADVEGLFENLPHERLLAAVDRAWTDTLWRALCRAWIGRWQDAPGRGVPQGAVLSPLLANLCLSGPLDAALDAALRDPIARPTPRSEVLSWEQASRTPLDWTRRRTGSRNLRAVTWCYRNAAMQQLAPTAAPPLVGWIRYGDDMVLVSAQRASGPRLLGWLDALVRAVPLRLSPSKTVLVPGGTHARPLPRPVLGLNLALTPCPEGWQLTPSASLLPFHDPQDPWSLP